MNIHAKIYMDETQISVRRALDDAIAVYGNPDAIMREKAIDAIAEGRAAYWTVSSYNNATASDLPHDLNRGRPIIETVEEAYPGWKARQRLAALDTIVPLNRKAATALANAYAKFGSWRDEDELSMRRLRDTRQPLKREPLTYANFLKSKGAA